MKPPKLKLLPELREMVEIFKYNCEKVKWIEALFETSFFVSHYNKKGILLDLQCISWTGPSDQKSLNPSCLKNYKDFLSIFFDVIIILLKLYHLLPSCLIHII